MSALNRNLFKAQQTHWNATFQVKKDLFGDEPSAPARIAAALFKKEGVTNLLELGGGQGRDTLFFARKGFQIEALDYAETGIKAIEDKVMSRCVPHSMNTRRNQNTLMKTL